jgi:iron complex transport system substrate-binding protein
VALVATTALAACGDDSSASEATAAPTATESAAGAFPVTVAHKFGTTTIPAEPERVVTIGWNDQDTVLALGVVPVAYRDWFEEYPTFPWVAPLLDGATPELIAGEVDLEAVAALEPDLILAVYDTVDQATYDRYASIAPTVVQTADFPDEATPWQEQTRLIGLALGRADRAEVLVTDLEARFDAAKAAHPNFADLTLVADFYPDLGTGEQWLLPSGDPRRQLFDRLGFGAQTESEALSSERLDVLDRDVLVVNGVTEDELLQALPVFGGLAVVQEDRAVFIAEDDPVSGALAYGSVLSLPYALEQLLPQLAAAADGDPATTVGAP